MPKPFGWSSEELFAPIAVSSATSAAEAESRLTEVAAVLESAEEALCCSAITLCRLLTQPCTVALPPLVPLAPAMGVAGTTSTRQKPRPLEAGSCDQVAVLESSQLYLPSSRTVDPEGG